MIELILAGAAAGGVALARAIRRRRGPDPTLIRYDADRDIRRIKNEALRAMARAQSHAPAPVDADIIEGTAVEVDPG